MADNSSVEKSMQEERVWSAPGRRFHEESKKQSGFFNFIVGMAIDIDEKSIRAAQYFVDTRDDEAEKIEYQKTIDEGGAGARKKLDTYRPLIFEIMLCKAVDNFLAYIAEIISLIYITRPETLRSSETITLEFVLAHQNLDDLIQGIVERKVDRLAYQGMRQLQEYLGKRIGFKLFDKDESLKKAITIIETRNLIVHNRTIVNKRYSVSVPGCQMEVGKRLKVDIEVFAYVEFMLCAAADIDERATLKYGIERS